MTKWLAWVGFLLLIPSVLINLHFLKNSPTNREYLVTKITDGDTFVVDGKSVVRLLGLDAPEVGRCGAEEATKLLSDTILNKKVTMHASTEDKFRRLVSDVYLNDQSVNLVMITSGWVAYDTSDSNEASQLKAAGEQARQNKLGIYGSLCTQLTNPSCNIKGNINPANGNKQYYVPGCGKYSILSVELWRGDQWFCSTSSALAAGFTKSGDCR